MPVDVLDDSDVMARPVGIAPEIDSDVVVHLVDIAPEIDSDVVVSPVDIAPEIDSHAAVRAVVIVREIDDKKELVALILQSSLHCPVFNYQNDACYQTILGLVHYLAWEDLATFV